MDEKTNYSQPTYRWGTFLGGVLLVILYSSLCAIVVAISFNREIPSGAEDISITQTATIIPTPQVLFNEPEDKKKIKFENFTSNFREWGLHYQSGKIEIINEKMILQSNIENIAIARNENFIKTSDTYYLQAELVTDIVVNNQQYGLVFGLNSSDKSFYLFEINPEYQVFRLFKFAPASDYQISNSFRQTPNNWILLIDYTGADVNQYPKENILGVFFKKGNIELFINGNRVATHLDEQPLQFSGVGVFVNNYGYRLIVDNFFAYTE